MDESLETLRDAIAGTDRALLELLRRRMDLAAEVGRLKATAGMPVVVREVEEKVLTRARQHAEACGLSEEVMEGVFAAIIRGSVERQHRVGVAARARRGARVLILGGGGAMGGWLQPFLALVGHRVDALDPAWASLRRQGGRFGALAEVDDLDAYDFLVISVPLAMTPGVLAEVAARRPRGTIVEIASIKDHLSVELDRARSAGLRVTSLHPMFGPGKSFYEPLTFVLACTDPPEEEQRRIEPLLSHPTATLVPIPFRHHDRLMGWLLGLAHLTGMLFGAALAAGGLSPDELRRCASTTYSRQAATAFSVLAEDADLYFEIQRLNPHRHGVYAAVERALQRLVSAVEADDRDAFRATLASARNALGH
jgi:chorismate mutase / prephenate dehydrogenase